MIYCQVKNGEVVNRALFDAPMPKDWPDFASWHLDDTAQIGWEYSGGKFIKPPQLVEPIDEPVALEE